MKYKIPFILLLGWMLSAPIKINLVTTNDIHGKIASQKALQFVPEKITNSVAASDAFFPFSDGIEELAKTGVEAIIQPGGSVNDKKVIEAANNAGLVMAFTGIRHFKH